MAPSLEPRVTHRAIQAAYHVAKRVPEEGCPEAVLRKQFRHIATGGIHNAQSLSAGMGVLEEARLLVAVSGSLVPTKKLLQMRELPIDTFVEILLMLKLTTTPDLWLTMIGTETSVPWELVPEDVQHTLCSTFPNEGARAAFVLNVARKVDQEALAAFGALGEEAVVTACRKHLCDRGTPHLAGDVIRVSIDDDTLGFDVVSPDTTGRRHRLEVKATAAPSGWVEFYISRNEATVGASDPDWSLVITKREIADDNDLEMRVAGWLTYDEFAHLLPSDAESGVGPGESGQWASCRIKLADPLLRTGLPLDAGT
ncbi:protein NO VEIN domain-containing protein [Streptomyces sp. F-7]|uniref:protein NO VEIN domain-containing protein n=1 Tax=Streptomyces sp. F-7 TaxID=573566 RepID=UPI000AC490F2|nr:DUF3883 domain-containing protein [Streptomyces sp. F-7]